MIYFDYFQCIVHVKLEWSRRGKCYLKLNHFYRTRNRTCIFEIIFISAEFNKKFIAYSKTTISNIKETICKMLFLLFSTFLTHIDIKQIHITDNNYYILHLDNFIFNYFTLLFINKNRLHVTNKKL